MNADGSLTTVGNESSTMSSDRVTQGSPTYAWYVAVLFFLCQALSYVDRQMMGILVQPMKKSLGLSDTEIGLLQGGFICAFFLVAAVPLSWLADRTNRVRLSAACIVLWSCATGWTGLGKNFIQLALARAGTAAAEAGLSPAALSILGDIFAPRLIGRVTALFMLGYVVGGGGALLIGGTLLDFFTHHTISSLSIFGPLQPWQLVFVAVALPGVLLSLLVVLTVREPNRRELTTNTEPNQAGAMSFRGACRFLFLGNAFYRYYFAGFACFILLAQAFAGWFPTTIIRHFDLQAKQVGQELGTIYLVSGIAGNLLAQFLGRARSQAGLQSRVMKIILTAQFALIPLTIAAPLVDSLSVALTLYGMCMFCLSAIPALFLVPLLLTVPNGMRGQTIGLFGLTINTIGGTLGPFLVGFINDRLVGQSSHSGLSLAVTASLSALAAFACLFFASRKPV